MIGLVIAVLYGAGRWLFTGEPFYAVFLGAANLLFCWYVALAILWFLAVGIDIINTGGKEITGTGGKNNLFLRLAGQAAVRGCFIGGTYLLTGAIESGDGAVRWLWPNILTGAGLFLIAFALGGSLTALENNDKTAKQERRSR